MPRFSRPSRYQVQLRGAPRDAHQREEEQEGPTRGQERESRTHHDNYHEEEGSCRIASTQSRETTTQPSRIPTTCRRTNSRRTTQEKGRTSKETFQRVAVTKEFTKMHVAMNATRLRGVLNNHIRRVYTTPSRRRNWSTTSSYKPPSDSDASKRRIKGSRRFTKKTSFRRIRRR